MVNSRSRSRPLNSFLRSSSSGSNLNGRRNRSGSFNMSMTGKSNGFRFWSGLSIAQKDSPRDDNAGKKPYSPTYGTGGNRGARDNAGGNDIIDRANGAMSPSGTKIAIFSNSHGKKAYKSKFNLPPVFPWLNLYLDTCLAKSTLFFHGILTKSHAVEDYNQRLSPSLQNSKYSKSNAQAQIVPNPKSSETKLTNRQASASMLGNTREWNDVQDVLWKKNNMPSNFVNNLGSAAPAVINGDGGVGNSEASNSNQKSEKCVSPRALDMMQNSDSSKHKGEGSGRLFQVANENNRRLLPMPQNTNLTKATILDFIGMGLKLMKRCEDTLSSKVHISLTLDVSSLKDGYPFSLTTGYVCPHYEFPSPVGHNANEEGKRDSVHGGTLNKSNSDYRNKLQLVVEDDEDDAFILSSEKEVKITSNYTKMTADLGVDDGIDEEPHSSYKRRAEERQHRYRDYVKPQGLKSWPVIFSLPTTFATSPFKSLHWPNIVSLLISGNSNLRGYHEPLFHHENRVGASPTSYYISKVDENVYLIIVEITKSSNAGASRAIIDFFRQVCPVLRMQNVFRELKPLKFDYK